MVSLDDLRLQTDFSFFSKRSGPDPITSNELIITKQHKDAVESLMHAKDLVMVAYRGRGKSTLVSFKYAAWRATQHSKTVCIFSASEDLAIDKLRILKIAFETDPHLNRYCAKGIFTWKDDEIWITDKTKKRQGPNGEDIYPVISRIKALGFDSRVRGMHFDIVICDDIVVEENSLTPDGSPDMVKIQKVKSDFNTKVVPIRNPGGAIILVGTGQVWIAGDVANSDLLYDWLNKRGKYSYLLPALTELGEVSCPELHTKEFLDEQKDTIGDRAWLKEYMLTPQAVNENVIDDDLIARCLNDNDTYYIDYIPKPNEVMIMGVDFAIIDNKFEAEKKNSAYFTLCPCAYDLLENKRHPKDLYFERGLGFSDQISKVIKYIQQYHIQVLALESHGGMRLFMNELQKLLPAHVVIVDATNFGNKFDTYTGLPSLTYLFEKNLIVLPNRDPSDKEKNGFLIHELKYMKTAQHKDLLDALLRVDTVIRTQYYTGTYNKDFTVRRINKKAYELSKLDEDINTVFQKPDEKKRKEILSERQKEIAYKNMLDEEAKINIKKKRDY